jgi:Arc/MetJ-type ribon-helix-helix transcriptional regulator
MSREDNAPFALQFEVEFLDRLNEPVREGKAKSVSEIIRTALDRFNLENVVVVRPPQVTISVRLPAEIRRDLKRVAREKHTSVGQLVRAAVESFLPHLDSAGAGQLEMAIPTAFADESEAPRPAGAPKTRAARGKSASQRRVKAKKPARIASPPAAKKKKSSR